MVISTEKLRSRLSLEGISEEAIKDCESIMLGDLAALQNQMKALQLKHMVLLDKLRQLEVIPLFFFHMNRWLNSAHLGNSARFYL